MNQLDFRAKVLSSFGATASERDELLTYNENIFDHSGIEAPLTIPLPDEPFVAAWEEYEAEAGDKGVLGCLKDRLVQLRFPIQEGISQSESYRAATRKGVPAEEIPQATGLVIKRPDALRLTLHKSPAGRIPVLTTAERDDLVSLVRALTMRNEPDLVPDSMGASMVAGYNNWDRIRTLRRQWQKHNPLDTGTGWAQEFSRIIPLKHLYQDRFIILRMALIAQCPQ